MLSLEPLFEKLQSTTGNSAQLASLYSSYGYYGYYDGGSSTERYVLRGFFARVKDQVGAYNKFPSYPSPLVVSFKNSSGSYAKTRYAPFRIIDNEFYVFIPDGWAESVYVNTLSTGITGYSWGSVHSACQGPSQTSIQDYCVKSYSTGERLDAIVGSTSQYYYCIFADSEVVGFCKEMNTQVYSLSEIDVKTNSIGDVTVTLKYTYTINVSKLSLKNGPTFGNLFGSDSTTIESIMFSTYFNDGSGDYITTASDSSNRKFYGMVEGADATNKTNSAIKSIVLSGSNNNGSFTSYKVTQANPSIITYWKLDTNVTNAYRPCRGSTPMAQQVPAEIPTNETSTTYYKNLVDAESELAYGYYPLISVNFYNRSSYTFYVYNFDVYYIRVFIVNNGSILTGSSLSGYKIKYGTKTYSLTESNFSDSVLYHSAAISQSPNNCYLASSISGDVYTNYSSQGTGIYFGLLQNHTTNNSSSISLVLCDSSGTELKTLTLTAYKTANTYNMNYFVFDVSNPRLYIGNNPVKKVYIGSAEVKEVWVGNTKVFP